MPELPEVETVVRDLRPLLVGRRITRVEVGPHSLRRSWAADWGPALVGRKMRSVERRGKWIVAALSGDWHLILHLGMTGQLTVTPADRPRADHTHLIFQLDGGKRELRFRDVRRFGYAAVLGAGDGLTEFFEEMRLGPEPFKLPPAYWKDSLGRTQRCLKAVLLDQRVLAGVGNIYADEALFEAKLHPAQLGSKTTPQQAHALRKAIARVLRRAIDKRGSSIRDYIGGSGAKGDYQKEFRVYGRAEEPCIRCRTEIVRIVLAGRSTHYCPRCQQV